MLSTDEEIFLSKQPESKLVKFEPFDPDIHKIVEKIIQDAHSVVPDLEIRHMGASALDISGQGDIDVYIFCPSNEYWTYLPKLEFVFGPKLPAISIIKWSFEKGGHEVEMYLTDPLSSSMQRQIKVFEALKNNPALLKEYEKLKEEGSGGTFKEYQRKKYEFYHKVLGE